VITAVAVLTKVLYLTNGFSDGCLSELAECNQQGFCSTTADGTEAHCSCFYGYEGESCDINIDEMVCAEVDCGFSGIQGECVSMNSLATCFCYTGWDGEDCSTNIEESVDYCLNIECNYHGACVEDVTSENNWSCECYNGWGGDECDLELPECGYELLLDMFTRLAFTSGDLESAAECGYAKPVIFSASKPSLADPMTFSFCVCSSLWEKFGKADYTLLTGTCVMDYYRKLPFIEESQSYCPNCNEDQDAIMEDVLTSKSAACYHFIYQRADMPLYWRSRWKCGCIMDVGTQITTETIVNCPFTQHTSSDDYISYDNCGGGRICDWEGMYHYFEEDYSQINLNGSVACKTWMEAWIFTEPGDIRFEAMDDTFCPCLDYLKGTGHDWVLDCIPVTFHQLSMKDLYEQICYDSYIYNWNCLNYIGYSAIELGADNYTASSLCYGALDLGSGMDHMNDNLNTLLCDCLVPVYNFSGGDTMGKALSCLTDKFDINVEDCENYPSSDDSSSSSDESTWYAKNSKSEEVNMNFNTAQTITESLWESVAAIEIVFCVVLILSASYLHRRKSKLNMCLE